MRDLRPVEFAPGQVPPKNIRNFGDHELRGDESCPRTEEPERRRRFGFFDEPLDRYRASTTSISGGRDPRG